MAPHAAFGGAGRHARRRGPGRTRGDREAPGDEAGSPLPRRPDAGARRVRGPARPRSRGAARRHLRHGVRRARPESLRGPRARLPPEAVREGTVPRGDGARPRAPRAPRRGGRGTAARRAPRISRREGARHRPRGREDRRRHQARPPRGRGLHRGRGPLRHAPRRQGAAPRARDDERARGEARPGRLRARSPLGHREPRPREGAQDGKPRRGHDRPFGRPQRCAGAAATASGSRRSSVRQPPRLDPGPPSGSL